MAKHSSLAYALYLLGRRGRTRQELRAKLLEKKHSLDEVEATLTRLTQMKLLDDAVYAEHYARDKVAIYRRGRYRVGLELLRKGVTKDQIDAALATVEEKDELEAAESLAAARVRNWDALEPMKRRARLIGLLQRRGFSSKIVRQVMDKHK